MLHYNTVKDRTLELLIDIMSIPELEGFSLAGGTSLSLQIGHRISYDLDFFGNRPFEAEEVLDLVSPTGNVQILKRSKNILILNIDDVKVDFVNYRYPHIEAIQVKNDLRLHSLADIAAMKMNAVTGRGRKRDFTDLYFLLNHFSFSQMIDFYNKKFADGNEWMLLRSLGYFADADLDESLNLLDQVEWAKIKHKMLAELKSYMN